jgi:hypothetical protein
MKRWTDDLQGIDDLPADVLALVMDLRRAGAGMVFDGEFGDMFVERVPAVDADLSGFLARLKAHARAVIAFMEGQPGRVPPAPMPAMDAPDADKIRFGKRLLVIKAMRLKARRGEWVHVRAAPR